MSRTLLRSLFTFDPRPTSEVEEEMRAEFDAHLAMLEDELLHQGIDPTAARTQALARFGDPNRLSREGKAIKLGDRIMLQRINLALLILVGAAVIFLLVQNQRISNRSVATLEQLTANLAALQQRQPAPDAPASAAQGPRAKLVYVEGLVERPGSYAIPPGGITLRRLLTAAGGLKEGAKTVYLDRDADGEPDNVLSTSNMEALDDPALKADNVITVSAKEDPRAPEMMQVEVRGYVNTPSVVWVSTNTSLFELLVQRVRPEKGAASVTIERKGPELWSKALPIGEATAEVGKSIAMKAGDVVTVLDPEADAAAPQGWKRYQRSDRVNQLAQSDRELAQFLMARESADAQYDRAIKTGYPAGHNTITELRLGTADFEGQVEARVRELQQAQVDEWAMKDDTLRRLVADRSTLEVESNRMLGQMPPGGHQWREWRAQRLKVYALDAQINDRLEELTRK